MGLTEKAFSRFESGSPESLRWRLVDPLLFTMIWVSAIGRFEVGLCAIAGFPLQV